MQRKKDKDRSLNTKKEESFIVYDGRQVPFWIIHEPRRSVRISFGSKAVTIRLPHFMSVSEKEKSILKGKDWAVKQLVSKPSLLHNYFTKEYRDGQTIRVGSRQYILHIQYHDLKTNRAVLKNRLIEAHLSTLLTKKQEGDMLKQLISKIVANDFYPEITQRIIELNNLHFRKKIIDIKIKLTQTNWGSCSAKGNINLSARLLFAPNKVIDYVIIHELAHLVELNHSARFWNLVATAMPDYKLHDQWLNKNGHLCEF